MAGKISELAPITGAALALTDDIEVRDISDLTMATTGTNKRIPWSELILFLQGHGMASGLIVDDVAPTDTSVLWADTTDQGSAANSVLAGTTAPTAADGIDGDFWINTTTWMIYGPKATTWPTGVSLVGPPGGGGGGVTDGDKGDITVSGSGATWMFDPTVVTAAAKTVLDDATTAGMLVTLGAADAAATGTSLGLKADKSITVTGTGALTGGGDLSTNRTLDVATAGVTLAKMANLAQDQFIGRVAASTGVPETATITAAARTVLDDTTVGAMLVTLGGQPVNANLTTIAGLTATTGNMILAVGSAWASQTPTQAKAALAIASTDVSGLGSLATKSAIGTADITDGVVSNTDLTTMAANTVKMNNTGATAAPQDVTVASLKTALAVPALPVAVTDGGTGRNTATTAYGLLAAGTTATGIQQTVTPAASGFLKTTNASALPAWTAIANTDVSGLGTLSTKSTVATADITNDAVDNTKLANSAANSFKGNNTGSAADPIDMTVAQAKTLLAIASTDVSGLGSLATLSTVGAAQITDGTVSNTELSTMATQTFKGRNTAGTGAPEDLSIATVKTMLGVDNITVASTAPSSPAVNDLWVDTT